MTWLLAQGFVWLVWSLFCILVGVALGIELRSKDRRRNKR